MALIRAEIFSKSINKKTKVNIIVPSYDYKDEIFDRSEKRKVLWLLHGTCGDYSDWIRFSNIENLARKYKIIVVMPSAMNSRYADTAIGEKYFTYITKELPEYLQKILPMSSKTEDNIIAGLSMGGYGALKIGLRCSEVFGTVVALSGGLDHASVCDRVLEIERNKEEVEGLLKIINADFLRTVFGEDLTKVRNSKEDCFYLAENFPEEKIKPRIILGCGTEDGNLEINKKMHDVLKQKNIPVDFFTDSGEHSWEFWDKGIKTSLSKIFE